MKYEPYKFITCLFLVVIFISSLILWHPISHIDGVDVSYIDALFTSTSALCVTGLNTIDFANTFNTLGLFIIALLIQLGGLGIICTAILVFVVLGQKINLKHRILIKNSFNLSSLKGIVKFVLKVFKITFMFEFAGMLLLLFDALTKHGILKSIGISAFHSISSFNNAGFDLLAKYGMVDNYTKIITMILIVLGGIGFLVITEIMQKGLKKLTLQTKIVLITTITLLALGTIGYMYTTELSFMDSLFLSVSTRTAGFAYFDLENISNAGYMITIMLMFIGASPNSTGGGIKTVTLFVLLLAVYSICRDKDYEIFKRSISKSVVNKCLVILFMAILVVFTSTLLISFFEPTLELSAIFFEVVSAFATVGLSLGITGKLTLASKIVLCLVMFAGRVGILTLLSIWIKEDNKQVKYPSETIIVG